MTRLPSRRITLCALAACAAGALPLPGRAQAYPSKPITFIVASTPGGILDTIGRIVAQGLEKMGQSVVVQNIPGAGSTLGTAAVAKAPPDGYTVGMVATSHAINPSVYAKLPYDTRRDLQPISHSVNLSNVLVVHPAVPARNLQEFIELAKKKPGEITFGSAGNGQSNHLSGELFNVAAGIRMTHVPYKGSAAAMVDVLGGTIHAMFVDVLSAAPHITSGKLRALAVSGSRRLPLMPEVPTFAEGGMAHFDANSWLGVVVRSGTPADVVESLGAAAAAVMHDPAVRAKLMAMGVEPVGSTPKEYAKFLDAEFARYAAAVKAAGIKLD
ncbi:MAG: tripartite tricarboxylate transporter substrate binding protein [Burkholderiaceae bacterium]|nr:tripartite tricarboxylate transporter substrate binding protein [Burkholderiaceae bacterium]